MTDDPRAALTAALDGEGPAAALRVLRHAIAWSARSVAAVAGGPAGTGSAAGSVAGSATNGVPLDTAAIEVVIALDDALASVDELLEQVPKLAQTAVAGASVTQYLQRRSGMLSELADQVAALRLEYEALQRVEAQLRAHSVEHDEVVRQSEELKRLERLAATLPELRRQHQALAQRLSESVQPVAAAEQALLTTAGQLVTLSADKRADLGERVRHVLGELENVETEWATEVRRYEQEKAQLAEKTAEYQRLRAERDQRLAALHAYAQIDSELHSRLSAAATRIMPDAATTDLRTLLDEIEAALGQVDEGLRDVLDRYDRLMTDNHSVLEWRDDPA